jgi:hypothetical protein
VSEVVEYGGYLPLELNSNGEEYYKADNKFNVDKLNSGRSSFYFAAKQAKVKKIYLPHFTCEQTETPFKLLGVKIKKYYLNERLQPKNVILQPDEFILWTNYYGNASDEDIDFIVQKYRNTIIDNSHAFFAKPREGAFNCYSTRKFFGVSDGAYLVKDQIFPTIHVTKDTSFANASHLIKQIDVGVNFGYPDNLINESRLEKKYLGMSKFTQSVLKTVNYSSVQNTRKTNFLKLHQQLGKYNDFPINTTSTTHMYYPLKVSQENLRYKLIEKKVFNPQWWRFILNTLDSDTVEYNLSRYTVMLPIDQRYDHEDMSRLANIVISCFE